MKTTHDPVIFIIGISTSFQYMLIGAEVSFM